MTEVFNLTDSYKSPKTVKSISARENRSELRIEFVRVVEIIPVRVVEMVPVRLGEMVPVLVVDIVPVLVVEMVPALVVDMVPDLASVGADIAKTRIPAQRMG